MNRLNLTMACGLYDRTQALFDGTVKPEGINLNFIPLVPGETFWRMLNNNEFDISEMSLSSYTILRARGDERFIAIPVFPSRTFRHSSIYINRDAGIKDPADLAGRRIGVGDYQMTAAVWVRGLLKDEYGVSSTDIAWVTGQAIQDINLPQGLDITHAGQDNPETMLERGEIDALISVMIPENLGKPGSQTIRLFPEFKELERDYFSRTGIFPIMHTIVIRRELYDENPWLAVSLYKAFARAKEVAYKRIYNTDALTVTLPWLVNEMEETRVCMGKDFWDYSIEGSMKTLTALTRYLYEQGLTETLIEPAGLFTGNISSGLREYLHATGEDR